MSKTLFAECYLNHNLGDDLFLVALAHRYPNIKILVDANSNYESLLCTLPNVKNINTRSEKSGSVINKVLDLQSKLDVVRNADCLVSIGGSIFIEPKADTPLRSFSSRHIKETKDRLILSANKHSFVIGANFGPYTAEAFLSFYRRLFKYHCKDICFRDQASFSLFRELTNTRVAPDLLFGTTFPTVNKNETVLFSVVNLEYSQKYRSLNSVAPQYLSWMLEAARSCYKNGLMPVISSFSSPEQDTRGCRQFCTLLEAERIPYKRCDYYNNPDALLSAIASSSLVIGTRFHATVLGLAANIPVIPILYSNKTINMLDDCGFNLKESLDLQQLSSSTAFPSANELVIHALNTGPFDISEQRIRSQKHFEALDLFLNAADTAITS